MSDDTTKHSRVSRSFPEGKGTWTPWGKAQGSTICARGIVFYHTAGHGGFHVSPTMFQKMPVYLQTKDRWYEEDCQSAMVVTAFPEFFTEDERSKAGDTLLHWFPDAWEQHTGRILVEGESYIKDSRYFAERHKNDYIVICASRSTNNPGMIEGIATIGGAKTCKSNVWKTFLIPSAEYNERGPYGFVIDLTKHTEISEKGG